PLGRTEVHRRRGADRRRQDEPREAARGELRERADPGASRRQPVPRALLPKSPQRGVARAAVLPIPARAADRADSPARQVLARADRGLPAPEGSTVRRAEPRCARARPLQPSRRYARARSAEARPRRLLAGAGYGADAARRGARNTV